MPLIRCKKCGSKTATEYSYCTECNAPTSHDSSLSEDSLIWRTRGFIAVYAVIMLSMTMALLIEYLWLIPKGIVTHENRELVFWILALPIQFMMFAGRSLITGQELRVGKVEYPLSRWARLTVLVLLFAFLGFLLAGQNGVFIGVMMAAILSAAIAYHLRHRRNSAVRRILEFY